MDEETKRLLKKNLELTEENNKLLRKMRRSAVVGNILRLVWWAVIIGVPVYLYLTVLQPYLTELSEVYGGVQTQFEGLQQLPSGVQDFLEKFGVGTTSGEGE